VPTVSEEDSVSASSLRIRLPLRIALGLSAITIVVAAASATAPGSNGAIAFRRYFNAEQNWGAVFTIAADGKGARQITHPTAGTVDDQPDWAPNGSLIAFSRLAPNEPSHVFVVAPNGNGLAPVGPLCPSGADQQTCPDDANASFSPDSKQLAFTQASGSVVDGQIEHSAIAIMTPTAAADT
jgi:Tol biopolymer transport system component